MEHHLRMASLIANLLDNQFHFFGIRFGLNGLLGLVPWVGDLVVSLLSLYMVWIGVQMRLPSAKLVEMIANVGVNFFIGLLPVVGDAVDFFHHANLKNLKILKDHAKRHVVEGEILESMQPVSFR